MSRIIEKILDVLQLQSEVAIDFLGAALSGKLGSSRDLRRFIRYGPKPLSVDWAETYRARQRFYGMLNYLVREGLVEKKKKDRGSVWKITVRGLARLREIKKRKEDPLSLLHAAYDRPKGNGFTIVVFDVPERERRKRDWLRACLESMGFKFLQKSVWLGRGRMDEEFIHALRERTMLDYIHIFSVNSGGTIREIRDKQEDK